jgi:cytochrome c553
MKLTTSRVTGRGSAGADGRTDSMKLQKIVLVSVLLVIAAVVARADEAAAGPADLGKQVVDKKKCSICHQIDGKGGKIGKPLNGIAEGKTDAQLKDTLLDPKKAIAPDTKMPSYKDKLTDDEINGVIAYLKTLKK